MECLQMLDWNNTNLQKTEWVPTSGSLTNLKIDMPDERIRQKVLSHWDQIAKPLDGLGRFEKLTAQIGAIIGTDEIDIAKKAVIIMCADNGIVEAGVCQSGQEVTLTVAREMTKANSSVGKMAAIVGADTIPVDIGINFEGEVQGLLNKKIRCGTRNFLLEPAMTKEETLNAIFTGIDMVAMCRAMGYHILATGEMGIGNTTTSSAVAAALLKCEVSYVTGRGAGLDDAGLLRKRQVIRDALAKYALDQAEPLDILAAVGGLDIAGLAGVCIGGALYHVPIVLDGVISMTAALLAARLVPGTEKFLLPSHKGKEPAVAMLLDALNLEAVIDGNMALGEGTGAVMMFSLLDIALSVYHDQTTFSDIKLEQYERYEHQ